MRRKRSIKWTVVAVGAAVAATAVAGYLWYSGRRNVDPVEMADLWVQDNPDEIADLLAIWMQVNDRNLSELSSRWIASMINTYINWDFVDVEPVDGVTHRVHALAVVSIGIPANAGLPYGRIYARVPWMINVNTKTHEVTPVPLFGEARLGVLPDGIPGQE